MENDMQQHIRYIGKIAGIMAAGSLLFFALMLLVFSIPDSLMEQEWEESTEILDEEGRQWEYFFSYARGAQLDNRTDEVMMLRAVDNPDHSIVYNAMDCQGYARYWHGYLIFLKPLMTFLSYGQIRYLYMFLYLLLLVAAVLQIAERTDRWTAFSFAIALGAVNGIVLPFSIQYSSVFFVMFAALLLIGKLYRESFDLSRIGIFFLVVGMLTSFVDLLTAPLLTLGVPLLYLVFLQQKQYGTDSCIRNCEAVLTASVLWAVGYLGNWAAKWILASCVLGRNVIEDGFSQGLNRLGNGQEEISGIGAIAYNLFAIVPPGITGGDLKWFVLGGLAVLLVLFVIFLKFHAEKAVLKAQLPILALIAYPYLWYLVMTNHSQIHYIFTYRVQFMTVWGGLVMIAHAFRKLKKA